MALRFYKAYLSMLFAGQCRFVPSCSQYSYEAVERFGLARGSWLTLKRLLRCHPFSGKFGFDPVPDCCGDDGDGAEHPLGISRRRRLRRDISRDTVERSGKTKIWA